MMMNKIQGRLKRYDGVILRLQKRRTTQLTLTIYTRQEGLLKVFAPKGKRGYTQGFGSLVAFSRITFDAWQHNGIQTLGEYDCQRSLLMDHLDWDDYCYTQIFTELVLALFPPHEQDLNVFERIVACSHSIGNHNIRVATIIAGWQLVACAGYEPDTEKACIYRTGVDGLNRPVYYIADSEDTGNVAVLPLSVPEEIRLLWARFLSYRWGREETLHISPKALTFLERLLYCYVEELTGRTLKSVSFS